MEAPAKTVNEYLNALTPLARAGLDKLRAAIKQSAPMAEETISYRIPTYRLNGPLVHFAAFTDHCSFITVNRDIIETFRSELSDRRITGTTIRLNHGESLPEDLVKRIVEMRIRQNNERA